MTEAQQSDLFGHVAPSKEIGASGTFVNNMTLPLHRWLRYSAGFSAAWVKDVLISNQIDTVLDPFVGSGTVCVVADELGIASIGVESHPFVFRLAQGKLAWGADVGLFEKTIFDIEARAARHKGALPSDVPALLTKCYTNETLADLFAVRAAYHHVAEEMTEQTQALVFLAINAILRPVSHVGTAQWQYVLPNKRKARVLSTGRALRDQTTKMAHDMRQFQSRASDTKATLLNGDARTLDGVHDASVDLVVTSPPYANNYDYADATRLEMTFWGEVHKWSDLHEAARKYLIRSSSQHASKERLDLDTLLADPIVLPIIDELSAACMALATVRETKAGNKAYHTMVAAYFVDMARVLHTLRRVTREGGRICFMVGDSAPYGVPVPVEKWLGKLAIAVGFDSWTFEKTRERNVKWKNRKHRVPLHEGRLWISG